MKIIKNEEELLEYINYYSYDGPEDYFHAYDIDSEKRVDSMKYDYPILIEYAGYRLHPTNDNRRYYKIRTKKDIKELADFIGIM